MILQQTQFPRNTLSPADPLTVLEEALTHTIMGGSLEDLNQAQRSTLNEVAALVIFGATNSPLAQLKLKQNVGRVLLAEFQALKRKDPILPLPMIAGLGSDFWHSWGQYATELPTLGTDNPQAWAARLGPLLQQVLVQAARPSNRRKFTPAEFNYLRLKLALPLAWPLKGGVR